MQNTSQRILWSKQMQKTCEDEIRAFITPQKYFRKFQPHEQGARALQTTGRRQTDGRQHIANVSSRLLKSEQPVIGKKREPVDQQAMHAVHRCMLENNAERQYKAHFRKAANQWHHRHWQTWWQHLKGCGQLRARLRNGHYYPFRSSAKALLSSSVDIEKASR